MRGLWRFKKLASQDAPPVVGKVTVRVLEGSMNLGLAEEGDKGAQQHLSVYNLLSLQSMIERAIRSWH